MGIREVTFYQAVCDRCGSPHDDGEYSAWDDGSLAIEAAADYGWFGRTKVVASSPPDEKNPFGRTILETVEVVCDSCATCDVCGEKGAYEFDNHLVCDEHEDHEFDAEPSPAPEDTQKMNPTPKETDV